MQPDFSQKTPTGQNRQEKSLCFNPEKSRILFLNVKIANIKCGLPTVEEDLENIFMRH